MRDFERHDLSRDSVRDPMDDDQAWEDRIQFVDLDPPGTSSIVGNLLRRLPSPALQMSRRTRWYIAAASVIGLLVLLVQVGWMAFPFKGSAGKDAARAQATGLQSSILLATVRAIYILDSDGNLNALNGQDGRLLWRYRPALLISRGVTVMDGVVYFIASDERRGDVYALRAATGALLWQYSLDTAVPTWFMVKQNMVYVSAQSGVISALRTTNGSVLWQYKGEPSDVSDPFVYLVDGMLYTCSQSQRHFVALQAESGALLWRRDTPFAQVFLDAVAGTTYIGSGDGFVSAFRARDGAPLWRAASSTTQLAMNFSFAVSHNVAYLITQNGTLDARRAQDGTLLWQFSQGYPIWGKLLLDDHILYVGAYDGTIYALHDDGRLLWRYSTKQSVGLLSAANGQLFIQGNSDSDSISALRASDGVLLWQRPMGQAAYFQSGAFLIVGRIVYVMTVDGTLNALREADGSLLWHRRILRPPQPLNDLLYASMLEGGVSALWADSGVARWHAG